MKYPCTYALTHLYFKQALTFDKTAAIYICDGG